MTSLLFSLENRYAAQRRLPLNTLHQTSAIPDRDLPVTSLFSQLPDDFAGTIGSRHPSNVATGNTASIQISRDFAASFYNPFIDKASSFTQFT
jgi:hypothetical protein